MQFHFPLSEGMRIHSVFGSYSFLLHCAHFVTELQHDPLSQVFLSLQVTISKQFSLPVPDNLFKRPYIYSIGHPWFPSNRETSCILTNDRHKMADRLCEFCIGCFSRICAVFCREITWKCSYIIQFTVYSILQGYNVASDIGMFFDVFSAVRKCNELHESSANRTQVDPGGTLIHCRQPGNFTVSDLDKHILTLEILQWFFLIFAGIGVGIYIAHLCILLPNLCKHCRDPGFEHEVDSPDTPRYYRNIVHIHTVFMCLETFIHDIPTSCLAVELSVHYFGPAEINCWECSLSATSIPAEISLKRSSMFIGLKISAVALITIYKGKIRMQLLYTLRKTLLTVVRK